MIDMLVPPLSSATSTAPWANLLPAGREALLQDLSRQLHQSLGAADENLGHLEEQLLRGGQELFRQILDKTAQQKADSAPPLWPHCQNKLSRVTHGHETTIQSRLGALRLQRARGWCRHCHQWRFPADALLGLPAIGTQSPALQEIAALTVSQMPAAQAEPLVEHLTGVKISAATLGRAARQQGERSQAQRTHLDAQMSRSEGRAQADRDLQLQLALEPFTLVIELDAWNLRARDAWGQSAAQRAAGQEPSRWHWVYGGTCFRLSQRAQSAGGRPTILSRGYAMTRGGVDALKKQLWTEAMRHGLGRAAQVLIVADGAVWICNLAGDRFPGARLRVDFYHVSQHLWSVAHALHPDDAGAARAWVEPMLEKLKADESCAVITELEQLRERLEGAARARVEQEKAYLETHRDRLDYGTAKKQGEPLGSGAMESTCRQYQVRFKRTGQFWSQSGDEALLCLETFRRNGRWTTLFPHARPVTDPCRN